MPVGDSRKSVRAAGCRPFVIRRTTQSEAGALSFVLAIVAGTISGGRCILDILRFILSTTRTTFFAHRLPTVPRGFVSVKKIKSLAFVTGVARLCSIEAVHRVSRLCRRLLPFLGRVLRIRGQRSTPMFLADLNKPDLARRKNSTRQRSVQSSRVSPSRYAIPMPANVIARTSVNGRSCPM